VEASKRERVILFGIVPIAAAVIGAVATVVIGHLTGGGGNSNDVIIAILKQPGLTPDQQAKLIALANESSSQFYSWLTGCGVSLSVLLGMLAPSIAERIRRV
jgi:hypothetical protein